MSPGSIGAGSLPRPLVVTAQRLGELLFEPSEDVGVSLPDAAIAVVALGPRCGCTTVAGGLSASARAIVVRSEGCELERRLGALEGPAVIEVPHGASAAVAASLAEVVVLVAGPAVEPALAAAAARSLAAVSRRSPLVAMWGTDPDRWAGIAEIVLPTAPLAARAARRGLPAPGPLGRALEALGDRVWRTP